MSNLFNIIADPHCDDGEMVMIKNGKVLDARMLLKERDKLREQLRCAVEALELVTNIGEHSDVVVSREALDKIKAMEKMI